MHKRYRCLLFTLAVFGFAGNLAEAQTSVYVPAQALTGDPHGRFQFNIPYAVATDSVGNIIVADTYNQLVEAFDPTGHTLLAIAGRVTIDPVTGSVISYGGSPGSSPFFGVPAADGGGDCALYNWDANDNLTAGSAQDPNGVGCFNSPTGVAVDSSDRIYVADQGNRRIVVLDSIAHAVASQAGVPNQLKWLTAFGTFGGWTLNRAQLGTSTAFVNVGSGPSTLAYPSDVEVDRVTVGSRPKDRVYVLDQWNNRIVAFDLDQAKLAAGQYQFNFVLNLPAPQPGSDTAGISPGQFADPQGFGVDQTTGNIAVSDTYNERLQVFQYPFTGTNSGLSLVVGATSVTDPGTGQMVQVPEAGHDVGQFSTPEDAAVDSQHRIWVTDSDNHRIQVLNSNGTSAFVIDGSGGQLGFPAGMVLDEARNRILVADGAVSIWQPAGLTPTITSLATSPSAATTGTMTIHIVNSGSVPLVNVQPTVTPSAPAVAYVTPGQVISPVQLQPGASADSSIALTFNSPGSVTFTVSATGRHDNSQTTVTSAAITSNAVTVQQALAATIAVGAVSAPAFVQLNQPFAVTVQVRNGGKVALSNVVASIAVSGASVIGPAQASFGSLSIGATAQQTLTYTGTSNGVATFVASATATNSTTGGTATPGPSQSAIVQIKPDITPPVTSLTVNPLANANGFWTGSVNTITVTLTATDAGTGVAQVCSQYVLLGTVSNQCAPCPAQATTCSTQIEFLPSGYELTVPFTYYSADAAGNSEQPRTMSLPIDSNPPIVQFHQPLPAPVGNVDPYDGKKWNNTAVTIGLDAFDGLSGVQSILFGGSPISLSLRQIAIGMEGEGIAASVIATDKAGNVSPLYASTMVNIDKTAPTLTASVVNLDGTPAQPNTNGAYTNPVKVVFSATDPCPYGAVSGLCRPPVGGVPAGLTVVSYNQSGINPATAPPAAGTTLTASGATAVSWTVCDNATNCTTASVTVTLSLPVITPGPQFVSLPSISLTTSSPTATIAMPDLTRQVVVSDATSTIASVTQSIPAGTPLTPGVYVLTFTATDLAGKTASTSISFAVTAPPTCTSGSVKFNMQATLAGTDLWLNAVYKGSNPILGGHLYVSHANVQFGTTSLPLPDAVVTFVAPGTPARAVFLGGVWVMTVPTTFTDNVFFTGLIYPLPAAIANNTATTMQACFSTDMPGFTIHWQAAAAAYPASVVPADYNALQVKPTHSTTIDPYNNGDQAGTPEAIKGAVVKGGTGGGGSNYTGSYSSTTALTPASPSP